MAVRPITGATDLKGKRVLVRGNLNVPVDKGHVMDAYRIEMLLPTLMFLRDAGAKIILCGHLGRDKTATLDPVARYLQEYIPVVMIRDVFDASTAETIAYTAPGTVILLENLRKYDGEEKNDPAFAKHLASFADMFVQDDFSVCHRKHASVVGVPKLLPSYGGVQLMHEIDNLSKAFTPEHPFLFILGGAKVETKMPLMEQFKDKADTLFVGGVLANDFFKAMGKDVGVSKTSDLPVPQELLTQTKIMLPHDVVVLRNGHHVTIPYDAVLAKDAIFDAGRQTVKELIDHVKRAKYIVWNGPLGYCEEGFCDATLAVAKAIAESSAYSVVGGGDSLAAIPDDIQMQFSFVSTGGGAMLDYLSNQTLVGISVLE
jgi:phosphoglycerate kinase